MAELSSWPTQNSGPTGTIDSREAATHIGALVYPHTSILKAKSGFRPGPGSSPGLVTATGTPDGFVHVAPFELLMQNIRGSGLGTYIAGLDAIKDINILSTPADPTNPRDDLIVAQQSDIFDADANSDFLVRHVVGTPAGVPADPAISGSTNVVALARVRVNANATTITSGNITDLRVAGHAKSLAGGLYTVALGGILPVASQAERDALTGVYNGLAAWRQDLKTVEISDGSAWIRQPAKIAETVLSGTAASISFTGIDPTWRAIDVVWTSRDDWVGFNADLLQMRVNNDAGANYRHGYIQVTNSTVTGVNAVGQTRAAVGITARAGASAGVFGAGRLLISDWNAPHTGGLNWNFQSAILDSAVGTGWHHSGAGAYTGAGPYTRLDFFPDPGAANFLAGTRFALYGLP